MPYIAMTDGSGWTINEPVLGVSGPTGVSYMDLRALLFERTSATPAGVLKGPGNPPTWIEFAATLMQAGTRLTINPNNVSILLP